MYTTYFGFQEQPFNLTPTPRLFYTNPVYEGAYTALLDGVRKRKGLMVLTGEVGTGKTTVLHRLMANLEEDPTVRVAFSAYSTLSFDELLSAIGEELGLAMSEAGRAQDLSTFTEWLSVQAQVGVTTVVLLDEAQDLDGEVLENLWLLLHHQRANEQFLQIILVGQQPELEERLSHPRLSQLRQHIAVQCQLEHLKPAEVSTFIHHRLRLVGCERQDLFSSEALQLIAVYSQGIPRLVNLLCDNALRTTYEASHETVSAGVIQKVAHNLRLKKESAAIQLGTQEGTHLSRCEDDPPPSAFADEPLQRTPRRLAGRGKRSRAQTVRPLKVGLAVPLSRFLIWGGGGALLTLLGLGILTSGVVSLSEGPNAVRGKVVLENLADRYQEVRPIVWGLATTTPALALLIPEAEWGTLSKEDQESLTWYLEGLIPAVRANPDQYIEEFRATPIYQTLRTKVASLCADCWLIGVGNLTLNEKSVLFGKVIVQGNSLWKKAPLSSRGTRASEFRAEWEAW